jgi:YHS domain-containing protein
MRARFLGGVCWAVAILTNAFWAGTGPAGGDEVPPAFAPFEHMVGSWKGTATPMANRVKGWPETHGWAWKFEKGKPVAMTVTLEGDKTLAKGLLAFDAKSRKYRLEGTDPAGKPVVFAGALSADGKTLTLDKVGPAPEGKERLIVRPNANKIRYMLQVDRQEPGAPQYKRAIEVGLTKEGESFAAGSSGADLPKCILTGGAATITVTYQGKSYPVCCSGCRDEFNENPEKYAKIAEAKASSTPEKGKPARKPAKGADDGSFDGLIDESKSKDGSKPKN